MFRPLVPIMKPYFKYISTSLPRLSTSDYAGMATRTGFRHLLCAENVSLVISMLNAVVIPLKEDNLVKLSMESIPTSFPISAGEIGCPPQKLLNVRAWTKNNEYVVLDLQIRGHPRINRELVCDTSGVYSTQLNEEEKKAERWWEHLKPVISVQLFDYNPSLETDEIKKKAHEDMLAEQGAYFKLELYTTDFQLQCEETGEKKSFWKTVPIDLALASQQLALFPPSPAFTLEHWWLSLLKHSAEYSREEVEGCAFMPDEIRMTFAQLDLRHWSVTEILEYKQDLQAGRPWDPLVAMLEVERGEGRSEGKVEVVEQLLRSGVLTLSHAEAVLSVVEVALLTARLADDGGGGNSDGDEGGGDNSSVDN